MSTAPASDGAIRAAVGESPGFSYGRFFAPAEAETIPISIPMFQPDESDTESVDGGARVTFLKTMVQRGSVVSWQDVVIVLPDANVEVVLPGAAVGSSVEEMARQERGWKLFLLLLRMLLQRPPGGGLLSKEKLSNRFKMFVASGCSCWWPPEHATRRQRQPAVTPETSR